MELKGIHHVSALTASAANNFDFYTHILGLRLVKKTVNQDAPSMYHLFYGDEKGNPGTELTFFEIPNAGRNRDGVSSISATSLRVADDEAIQYWQQRFTEFEVENEGVKQINGRLTLPFKDFEGQRLMMVSDANNVGVKGGEARETGPIPKEYGITGLGPVRLTVRDAQPTVDTLIRVLGFREKGTYPAFQQGQPDVIVLETGEGGTGAEIHVEERDDLKLERPGRGGVHHVAFRVDTEEELRQWVDRIQQLQFSTSGFVDRYYFRSLYFREPNGILFELATDGPGFEADEPLEHLGESLALPPFLEPQREETEAKLKPIDTKQ
ncbi:ring-cleaving dioxygenase [Paenibacillus sp. 481]|uniref:ring-cleaving dioxygenase n=1 Tax=Paenibacillus sp. 481 TaxID=2835869 RepID=UPI001E2DC550|nr:ring-cleaving dioxygenase [Paenibacillus sp. 481]UHA76055.1 ring-cleaving dioxygenase [Paenibacillus sp. 481]